MPRSNPDAEAAMMKVLSAEVLPLLRIAYRHRHAVKPIAIADWILGGRTESERAADDAAAPDLEAAINRLLTAPPKEP